MIYHLISSPRTVSTALMYAFAQHSNMKVIDEPFYAVYLIQTGLDHPARSEILSTMPNTQGEVVKQIDVMAENSDVFVKNMAAHFISLDPHFCTSWCNIFFIRDPAEVITSFAKVIDSPTAEQVGIERQRMIFEFLKAKGLLPPIVLDSNDLLNDPAHVLSMLCEEIELSFEPSMLTWPKGPKSYDGVWANYWYSRTHQSSGFTKRKSESVKLEGLQLDLYRETAQHYRYLYSHSITNPDHASKI